MQPERQIGFYKNIKNHKRGIYPRYFFYVFKEQMRKIPGFGAEPQGSM